MDCLVTTMPSSIPNLIDGNDVGAASGATLEKRSPHDGRVLWTLARSGEIDVGAAVASARAAQREWGNETGVARGAILHRVCSRLEARADEVADVVARETGKSPRDAGGEVAAAIACGRFFAGEGQRMFGRTMPSQVADKYAMTVRQPIGVAGLVIAANTPAANVAWKVFPALICGNGVVLKAPEDAPATAWLMAHIAIEAGVPAGALGVVQGLGAEAGAALVADRDVDVISFTGSTAVGREIARVAGERLARVSLELGGKNPFVVCDDADLDQAVKWAALSAFSNAGQRCAAASRMIVFRDVYDEFRTRLVAATKSLRVGPTDDDDLGPVISEAALDRMLSALERARAAGATVVVGGTRLDSAAHRDGWYIAPTVVEEVRADAELSELEVFGPIAALYRVDGFDEALALANRSPYGLTAAIHTRNWSRALEFAMKVRAGVASVNAGTYGSEPHMPFGGTGQSGNGTREPGTEALDVYSQLKDLYFNVDRNAL